MAGLLVGLASAFGSLLRLLGLLVLRLPFVIGGCCLIYGISLISKAAGWIAVGVLLLAPYLVPSKPDRRS